jgi:hypothetical protein
MALVDLKQDILAPLVDPRHRRSPVGIERDRRIIDVIVWRCILPPRAALPPA